jgi:hypothetical protein
MNLATQAVVFFGFPTQRLPTPKLPQTFHDRKLSHEEECRRILGAHSTEVEVTQPDPREVHLMDQISVQLDRQFATIQNRAQLLLGLCGILISASVLVASVRIMNSHLQHQALAGGLLVTAGSFEIAAAWFLVWRVLEVRWMTQQPGTSLDEWILTNLRYRDQKTRAYRVSTALVLFGMIAYQVAVAIAVLDL